MRTFGQCVGWENSRLPKPLIFQFFPHFISLVSFCSYSIFTITYFVLGASLAYSSGDGDISSDCYDFPFYIQRHLSLRASLEKHPS